MDETAIKALDKLTDPLIPARAAEFWEILELLDITLDERFIINVLTQERIVPVTDHPLHQKKVLALAGEFRTSGFPGVSEFLANHVLAAPDLNDTFRDRATGFMREQATR